MRRDEDPLERYLWSARHTHDDFRPEYLAYHHAALHSLAAFLDRPPAERGSPNDVNLWAMADTSGLDPADVPLAQELYYRVCQAGGPGSHLFQESLLHLVAATANPISVPFWRELLEYARPRDQFRKRRQRIALAALALLAIRGDSPIAEVALRQATGHENAEVRAVAVHHLGQIYQETECSMPADLLAGLADTAVNDPAFGPRFMARAVLRTVEQPIPLDNPDGVYELKVKFKGGRGFYRTIAVRSVQTLDDLHHAIQRAIEWGDDHLYSFFMNGQLFDPWYTFACPEEDEHPPWTDEAIIGELGLVVGHKFVYYFDYGDCHEFEVEVVDVRAAAEPGEYPRVVDSQGATPFQYQWQQEDWEGQ